MIFIDRNSVEIPTVLKEVVEIVNRQGEKEIVETKSTKELKNNIELAERGEFRKFKFSAYAATEVRKTLEKLCKEKCAYCESRFRHVYTGDIEHFRPKGKITEANPNQVPGYYWLAADWNNLLLSCRHCNQTLIHEIYGIVNKDAKGKFNQFPLMEGKKHVQSHVDAEKNIQEEEKYRLLINPCIENPEDFFVYLDEGIIKPKYSIGKKYEMAKTSIDVYALQRMPLVQSREKILIEIKLQMQRVNEASQNLSNCIKTKNQQRIFYDKILKRELIKLKKFTNSNEEYAGMARYVINEFINGFNLA